MAGKGPSRRPEQVAEAIRTVLAEALVRGEVRDPRVSLVTVVSVDVTRDLSVATVRVAPSSSADDSMRNASAAPAAWSTRTGSTHCWKRSVVGRTPPDRRTAH